MAVSSSNSFGFVDNRNDEQITATDDYIKNFFQSHSDVFREWLDIRVIGRNNNTIQSFFDGRANNQFAKFTNNEALANPKYLQEQFRKFRVQIRDIDMDLDVSSKVSQRCTGKKTPESFSFLEFGCVPGGIATFILDINWRIRGAGVTLPVDLGGYGVSPVLKNDPRFEIISADLTEEAKKGRRLRNCFSICGYPRFSGFDLIINGITVHRRTHLHQRVGITLAQLYYALTLLQDGGMLLVVLNANIGFHTLQFLYMLLNLFDNCKAVKPIAIYPIRKSYWILCTGFKRQKLQSWNLIEVLQEILTSARGLSPDDLERHVYYLGNAFPVPGDTYKLEIAKMIAVKWGAQIIELMNPVWDRQRESIKQVVEGKKWTVCEWGKNCRRPDCFSNNAHSEDELITIVKDRLEKLGAL